MKELIQEARKKRSIYEEPDINEFEEITDEIKKEIEDVFTQKSKFIVIITSLKPQEGKHALWWRNVPISEPIAGFQLNIMQNWKCLDKSKA